MLPAASARLARHHVQHHHGGRVDCGSATSRRGPARSLPRRTLPSRSPCRRSLPSAGASTDDRPPVTLGQDYRLTATFACGHSGELDGNTWCAPTHDLEGRPADRLGGAAPPRGAARRRRIARPRSTIPRFIGATPGGSRPVAIGSVRSACGRASAGSPARFSLDWRSTLPAPIAVTRSPRQATAASWWHALDVGLRQGQPSRRFLQSLLGQLAGRVGQRRVG